MRYMLKFLTRVLAVVILAAPALATQTTVYPFGRIDVTVPVSQSINIMTSGSAKISKQIGGPSANGVPRFIPESTVTAGVLTAREVTFGPYTVATVIRIESGADPVYYAVGALAAANPVLRTMPRIVYTQLTPIAKTTAVTLLAGELSVGLITGTHTAGATQAYTLPTGTLSEAALGMQIGQGFEWTLINLSAAAADSITVTAGSGHTIVGDGVVISTHVTTGGSITSRGCSSSRWLTTKTALNTFITYRLN